MPEKNYMSHSAEECFGKRTNQQTIKDGLGVHIGGRYETVKQYTDPESKWNKGLKYLKKQNKMLYSITKKSVSRREIKKIKEKSSNKGSDSSSDDSDYNSSLSSNSS